ncbi:uncharacterized protein LOC125033465 [Penaeus chinensis]|uniref:uncharacterized protein LOC125033465 n=1 Tax=Penaeus chinensis TaxID=139456 RepID=UPI001FB612C8|nr:uncharacterized protein LOC125033465 [Penaeus chinensis]
MFLGRSRPNLVWWTWLVYLAAAEEECGPWLTSSPSIEQEIDLNPLQNANLWFRPEVDFARITFFVVPRTIEPWSFVLTNASLMKAIFLSQPTAKREGKIIGPFITTTFGYNTIRTLNVTSNVTVFWNVCTSPYVCTAPPTPYCSEFRDTVLGALFAAALVVAVGEAGYICYRRTREGARPSSAKATASRTDSDTIYEEWNENWLMRNGRRIQR